MTIAAEGQAPLVSIVIVNWQHPELIDTCLRTLDITDGVPYEVVVVDNGSGSDNVARLQALKDAGLMTTLVEERVNHYFSAGNNIGFRHTNPASQYILLLNSDVAFRRADWLTKMLAWMEGTAESHPDLWTTHPTVVKPGPFDIISIGWSYEEAILPGHARPEGWCYMVRRQWWRDLDEDFPMGGGLEHTTADTIRAGARCGVLFNYPKYLVHREQGSHQPGMQIPNWATPNVPTWFYCVEVETLDFTLGPDEHSSYMCW